MATASNPFRRKQDLILGIDVSNHTSRPTSQALSRQDTLKSIGGRSIRTIGSIPAGISQIPHIPEETQLTPDSEGDGETQRFMDIRRESESLFSRGSGEGTYRDTMAMSPDSENFDPSGGEEELDDEEYDSLDDEFSLYAGSMSRSKTVARRRALREGRNSMRSSSALGYRTVSQDGGSVALPSKAERMLGMSSKQQSRVPSAALRPREPKSGKSGLPAKAQRLLGVRSDNVSKSRKQQERESSSAASNIMMMMNRTGSEGEDFRKMLLTNGDKGPIRYMGRAESTSDASSLSKNSIYESQTSRSSREMLSPDSEHRNSTAPPWIGVHPAFRGRKPSSDYDGMSPISPYTAIPMRDAGYSGKMVVSDFKPSDLRPKNAVLRPPAVVELDAGPASPAELPVPVSDMLAKSLPSVFTLPNKPSSAPTTPVVADRPRTSRSDNPPADDATLTADPTSARSSRPSAIFDNPDIFEMPGDMPAPPRSKTMPKSMPSNHRSVLGNLPAPSKTPPPGDNHNRSSKVPSSPVASRSPFPPPSRPLPKPPQRRRSSDVLTILPAVAFDGGRTRKHSEDVPISPRSPDPKSFRNTVAQAQGTTDSETSSVTTEKATPTLSALDVPSPLALAHAAGRPVTKNAPPPLPSSDEASSSERAKGLAERSRVELSDKSSTRSKKAEPKATDDQYRPFSWQSTKTTRSMTMEEDAPPMPPPLALKIPAEASSKVTLAAPKPSATVTATPLTATSARSRASRLEKALESALSKDGMQRAIDGERIEDLFRDAGADELFAFGLGPRTEGLTEEEDDEDAKEAASRAQNLLKELSVLQKEVDQLRRLYGEGGPLEGESPFS